MSTDTVININMMSTTPAMTKVSKALRELEEEASLRAVDAFVAEMKKEFELEDIDAFVEKYKAAYTQKMKDEAKEAAKKPKKAVKTDDSGHVVKRAPSDYNIFIRETMLKLKQMPENADFKGKQLMAMAAAEWKKSKSDDGKSE